MPTPNATTMSTNRGIFESFPNQPAAPPDSPFENFSDPAMALPSSPFPAVARMESPFTVVEKAAQCWPVEPGQPARVPERRKFESPFEIADPAAVFGFEAPDASPGGLPVELQRGPSPSTPSSSAGLASREESPASAPVQATAQMTPSAFASAALALVPLAVVAADPSHSDSFSIRQLELRAIFGVDRELNPDEILARSRTIPGLRHVARVSPQDMATLEALKQLLPNLGFGSGGVLKLYADSAPLDFIREGAVMLAVQTEGGFAPGVRETLMLVARELDRLP